MGGEEFHASAITDRAAERKRVSLITFAAFSGACAYIIMLFIAMPLSIHLIVNGKNGCDPDIDTVCFAPTDTSQDQLTLTLTLLRATTFLCGSLVGAMSDRYGRKPLLIFALGGYALTGLCFLIGWKAQEEVLFVIGAIVLGAASPINPHGIAYISDISVPDRLAKNLGYLQGFGYFLGLMGGAGVSLVLSYVIVGEEEEAGEAGLDTYSTLFYAAYGAGTGLACCSTVTIILLLPESLVEQDRVDLAVAKANPFGFVTLVTRNGYFFLIFMSGAFGWMSVGAGEAVTGGWFLRRFLIADVTYFVTFLVVVWVLSAFGAVIMTGVYVQYLGLKGAIHISYFFTILAGIVLAVAPNSAVAYGSVAIVFFATPVLPTTLAVIMGQVDGTENGALAGAIRSAEALSKLIGILIFGTLFSDFISPFTPASSCVPGTYPASRENDCECGVKTCPNPATLQYEPSECTTGQLSSKVHGKYTKFVKEPTGGEDKPILAQYYIDNIAPLDLTALGFPGDANPFRRQSDCLGPGLIENEGKGLITKLPRAWCLSPTIGENLFGFPFSAVFNGGGFPALDQPNVIQGCPDFDLQAFGADATHMRSTLCCTEDENNPTFNATWALTTSSFNSLITLASGVSGQSGSTCNQLIVSGNEVLPQGTVCNHNVSGTAPFVDQPNATTTYGDSLLPMPGRMLAFLQGSQGGEFSTIAQLVFDDDEDNDCSRKEKSSDPGVEFGLVDTNVCAIGVISDFPGIYPLLYGAVLPGCAWLCFIAAELLFKDSDAEYWKNGGGKEAVAIAEAGALGAVSVEKGQADI
uniref:Major facilitator superfamily (MFS) profile domain-containing protein n=1 Tax=Aplanochytrium stocchinoi TaxID=215587 RepID=A0A7S3LJ85_9STRA